LASKVSYKASVERDLKRLDRQEARKILNRIEGELGGNPDKGEPLKGVYQGLYRYRIGDYRVIYAKTVDGVLVLRIGHRRDVYR
jgi:mRNA interferase RelE/StbE